MAHNSSLLRSRLRNLADSLQTDGYASLNGGTTGGNYKDLTNALLSTDPMIIIVDGTIKTTDGGDNRSLNIRSK